MRCDTALVAILDRERGALPPRRAAALARHLARCPACAAEATLGSAVATDLAVLRAELPFEIDVTARVRREIAALGRPAHAQVPGRELAWGSLAAVAACVVLAAGLRADLPLLLDAWHRAAALVTALGAACAPMVEVGARLFASVARVAAGAIATAAAAGEHLRPLIVFFSGLSATVMAATVALVISRDLRRAQQASRS